MGAPLVLREGKVSVKSTRQRRLLVFCCVGIGLVGYAGYVVKGNSSTLLTSSSSTRVPPDTAISPQKREGAPQKGGRAETWRILRSDLFTPAHGSPPSPPFAADKPDVPLAPAVSPPALPVPDPLADYAYTGTVTVDGAMFALIERRSNKQGWYVQTGDVWQNYRIIDVSQQAVTLLVEGKKRILPKSDVINLVPMMADTDKGASQSGTAGLSQIAQAEFIDLGVSYGASSLSAAEIAHVKDEVFEGHMSAEDADRILEKTDMEVSTTSDVIIEGYRLLSVDFSTTSNEQSPESTPSEPAQQSDQRSVSSQRG